jgi:prepilin-type N-terminal cleavage/methylation domain-containing protein
MTELKNSGYTLVEVAIALAVTAILIFSILDFTTNMLVQYTATTTRAQLLGEAQTALDIVNNDIRLSASADQNNRWEDDNAPAGGFSWQSDGDTLVLATAVEDNEDNIIFADPAQYISQKNNIVYYLSSGSLYKRVIAAPVVDNSATTTCPPAEATQTCPADKKLLQNVSSFQVKYLDGNNNEVIPPEARSIELTAELYTEEFSQPISVSYTTGMVFRND